MKEPMILQHAEEIPVALEHVLGISGEVSVSIVYEEAPESEVSGLQNTAETTNEMPVGSEQPEFSHTTTEPIDEISERPYPDILAYFECAVGEMPEIANNPAQMVPPQVTASTSEKAPVEALRGSAALAHNIETQLSSGNVW